MVQFHCLSCQRKLILCTLRHFSSEQSLQTAQLVERFRGTRVAALDLAGDEAGFPLAPHIPAYQYAANRNLPRTAHAGETSGPESIWETLRSLHPSRIGRRAQHRGPSPHRVPAERGHPFGGVPDLQPTNEYLRDLHGPSDQQALRAWHLFEREYRCLYYHGHHPERGVYQAAPVLCLGHTPLPAL